MMILVMREDGRTDMVPKQKLQTMLTSGAITKFIRDGHWAKPGQDMLRRVASADLFTGTDQRMARVMSYSGTDRRAA